MSFKNKKIVILVNDLNFFCSHRLPIAEAAKDLSFKIVIGYGEEGGADPILLNQKGFNTKYVPMKRGSKNLLKDLISFFKIIFFLKKEKPDLVHLVTIKPYLYGGIASRLVGVPSVVSAVSGLGTLFVHKNFKSKFLRFLTYPIYRLAFNHPNQIVIVQNRDDSNVLTKWNVLNYEKIRLIKGSGVQLKNFINLEEPAGIPTVCFAARLLIDKGVNEFISAARILKQRQVKAKFILAGDLDKQNPSGLKANDLQKIIEEKIVNFIGFQEDIPSLYSKSHIICLPSYREGLPKALLEAAAARRPIVTTNVPGCRDAVISDKSGILVPIKDSLSLANALQELIIDASKRKEMGKTGRELAEKEFKIENVVDKHIKIYKYLLVNRGKI